MLLAYECFLWNVGESETNKLQTDHKSPCDMYEVNHLVLALTDFIKYLEHVFVVNSIVNTIFCMSRTNSKMVAFSDSSGIPVMFFNVVRLCLRLYLLK